MKHWLRKVVIALIVLGLAGGAAAWYMQRDSDQGITFRTGKVTRGDLLISISATGTLEPEEVIDVGAQVAGQIIKFGKDVDGKQVDYGSRVDANTVLAEIDPSLYQMQYAEAQAQVQQANASLGVANANLLQAKAKLDQAQRDWDRAQKLGPSEALAQAQYDSYKSAFETAQANVAVCDASILEAKASIAQDEAAAQRAKRNLDYCTIKSPVKGVIIDRRVNAGQTVVASLNAPSLFLLAKDLNRMQVWVAVNEADIGKIHAGQPVTFTVDAFPGETFQGEVGKVRLNASMTQNVVTYTVEIITDNSSGRLLPYLTANVKFELDRRNNVFMVPNAALRWMPTLEQIQPEARDAATAFVQQRRRAARAQRRRRRRRPSGQRHARTGAGRLRPRNASQSRAAFDDRQEHREAEHHLGPGRKVRPAHLPCRWPRSDGSLTEIQGEGLTEGLDIALGVQAKVTAQADATNPFAPRFPSRGGTRGAGGGGGGGMGGARGGGAGGSSR